jgi:hypothetical protein
LLKVKELNDGTSLEEGRETETLWRVRRGGYPIPGILQSVRKRLIAKEFEETDVLKCEASVRKK